jgi:hypothetical protein
MHRPSHSFRFDHPGNIWRGVQNTRNFCEYFRFGVRSSDRRQYSGPLLRVLRGKSLIIIAWTDRLSVLPNRLQIHSGSDGEQIRNQTIQFMATQFMHTLDPFTLIFFPNFVPFKNHYKHYCGMWQGVLWCLVTDISVERTAAIFRV